jgi:hypothetical protein
VGEDWKEGMKRVSGEGILKMRIRFPPERLKEDRGEGWRTE